MKILIVAPSIYKPYLGPSSVAHNILKGFIKINDKLMEKNIKMTFLSLNEDIKLTVSENIDILGKPFFPPVTFTGEFQALIRRLFLKEKFDLVHSHDIFHLLPFQLFKTPIIFTLHGIYWRERKLKEKFYSKICSILGEFRFQIYYPYLTRFVAISPYVLDEMKPRGFDTSKAVVIGNPVSDEFFNVKKRDENIILYPATLILRKNQHGFLKAVSKIKKELNDYKIVFTASGDIDYISNLNRFAKSNNLNVEFLGKVPYKKMLELYSKASIVALTSFQETLPMSVLEAMASGTPVLASNVGGLKYLIKDNENGLLVNPYNTDIIAEKILILIQDENLRKKMGQNSKRSVEEFRCEHIAERHLNIYLS